MKFPSSLLKITSGTVFRPITFRSKMSLDRTISGPITIQKLPENILLEILRYLSVKQRCLAGRVCKQWHRVTSDNSLWRHVDLLEYKLDLASMWKFLRARLSPCLLTIKIRGYAHAGGSKKNKTSISNAMLKEMSTRCPNLWLLHLFDCNTHNISFESLPASITSLSITNSTWQSRWMKDKQQHLPKLEYLNLGLSVRVDNFDVEDIAYWTNLKTLSLSGCYRIHSVPGTGLEVIAKDLLKLESLNLTGTGVDDLCIHHIARHLKDLQNLSLCSCSAITDSSLSTLAAGLPKLISLDISYCESLTVSGLSSLKVSKLKFLNVVRKVRLTEEEVCALRSVFAHQIYTLTA